MLRKSVFLLLSLMMLSPALLLAQSDEELAGAAASAGGCLACGGFFMIMGLSIIALNIALLVFVYKDARNRGMDNAVVWLIVVLFFPLLGVIVYLLARTKGDLVICPHCGGKRMQVSAKCPHCGNA